MTRRGSVSSMAHHSPRPLSTASNLGNLPSRIQKMNEPGHNRCF